MLYTKIRMDFKYADKGRFYRVLLIKGNPDLLTLGVALGDAVSAEFEHCFLITTGRKGPSYVMAPFMEDPLPGYCALARHTLDELPEHFDYEYDTGDGWDFACKRYKKKVELDSKQDVILLEGAGQGVWEDNIGTLYDYFAGRISKDSGEEDPDNGIAKPWNFSIDTYGEFDSPLDIDSLNDDLASKFPADCRLIKKQENDYIKKNEINMDDYTHDDASGDVQIFPESLYLDIEEQISTKKRAEKVFNFIAAARPGTSWPRSITKP